MGRCSASSVSSGTRTSRMSRDFARRMALWYRFLDLDLAEHPPIETCGQSVVPLAGGAARGLPTTTPRSTPL